MSRFAAGGRISPPGDPGDDRIPAAAAQEGGAMSGTSGGYIPGSVPVVVEVAECVVRADDVRAGRALCCRTDLAHLYAAHRDVKPLRARDGVSPACGDACDQPLGHSGRCPTLDALATVYPDRSGFDSSWVTGASDQPTPPSVGERSDC